jgi:hypothetical protein
MYNQNNKSSDVEGFDSFESPILNELIDDKNIARIFTEFPVVPYFGTNENSSDSMLSFIQRLAEISPTQAGCIESKTNFTVPGFDLFKGKRESFLNIESSSQIPSFDDALYYQEFLASITDEHGIGQFGINSLQSITERITKNLNTTGNSFLQISRFSVAGERYASISALDANECRYERTGRGKQRFLLVSPSFQWSYLRNNKPNIIPLYPNFAEDELGVERSIIHISNVTVGRRWYGLSNSISSLYFQFLEWQLAEYLTAETANKFTGEKMFDFEKDDEDDDSDLDLMQKYFDTTFTNKAKRRNKKSVLLRARVAGTQPATVTQFTANTNENFYDSIFTISENKIIASNAWFTKLLYDRATGLGGDELKSLYKIASYTVLGSQNKIATALNTAISECANWKGDMEADNYYLSLGSLYKQFIGDETEVLTETIET